MICGEGKLQIDRSRYERGVALLAVLWLSVALTMIAMTTAYLVRSEASAVSSHLDAGRAEFLARGGIEAALYAILRTGAAPEPAAGESSLAQPFHPGQRWMRFDLPEGFAAVELVPENAKININFAPPEQLAALFALLGEPTEQSQGLAAAIVDWRTPRASSVETPLDVFYEGLPEPYTARHAPFEDLEELLAVKGMSRDLFFGRLVETPAGSRQMTPPLADLLTTEPSSGGINLNYAAYEVLRVLPRWDESLASAVIEARTRAGAGILLEAVPGLSAAASLSAVTLSPGPAYTLTATGEVRGSSVRHTVRARIRMDRTVPMGYRVTGWWEDWPWSGAAPLTEPSTENDAMQTKGGSRL
jgi:type II secretory pathway component PulK